MLNIHKNRTKLTQVFYILIVLTSILASTEINAQNQILVYQEPTTADLLHHPWRHDARPYWQPWYDNPRYYWPGFNATAYVGDGLTGGCYSQWERDHLNGWVKTRYCY